MIFFLILLFFNVAFSRDYISDGIKTAQHWCDKLVATLRIRQVYYSAQLTMAYQQEQELEQHKKKIKSKKKGKDNNIIKGEDNNIIKNVLKKVVTVTNKTINTLMEDAYGSAIKREAQQWYFSTAHYLSDHDKAIFAQLCNKLRLYAKSEKASRYYFELMTEDIRSVAEKLVKQAENQNLLVYVMHNAYSRLQQLQYFNTTLLSTFKNVQAAQIVALASNQQKVMDLLRNPSVSEKEKRKLIMLVKSAPKAQEVLFFRGASPQAFVKQTKLFFEECESLANPESKVVDNTKTVQQIKLVDSSLKQDTQFIKQIKKNDQQIASIYQLPNNTEDMPNKIRDNIEKDLKLFNVQMNDEFNLLHLNILPDDIKTKYKQLSIQWHPDKHPNNPVLNKSHWEQKTKDLNTSRDRIEKLIPVINKRKILYSKKFNINPRLLGGIVEVEQQEDLENNRILLLTDKEQ